MNLVKCYRIATVAITALVIANFAYADPPGRVARLSLAEGEVSFAPVRSESDDNWSAAQINWPITGGNRLYADDDARAELQIGASSLRLAEETAIDFTRLDDERVEAYVTQGTIHVTLRHWDNNDPFVITTPTLSVTLSGSGRYRIDVDDDGENATVSVRQGEAQVLNGNSRFNLIAPQRAEISGWDGGDVSIERSDDEDDFDRWAADRDRRQEVTTSSRYVEPTTPGLYELDHHGQWRDTSDYGHVWTPNNVAADWAPYRHGRWAWVEPWGWTWIDDARLGAMCRPTTAAGYSSIAIGLGRPATGSRGPSMPRRWCPSSAGQALACQSMRVGRSAGCRWRLMKPTILTTITAITTCAASTSLMFAMITSSIATTAAITATATIPAA